MNRLLVFLVLACTFLVNCTQKKSENVNPDSYFPNSIGDTYTYRVTDSINNKVFNVIVSVVGKTTMSNGQPVNIWTYKSQYGTDTSYVFSNKDSVVFYANRQTSITQIHITNGYNFPLNLGAKWRVSFIGDTSTVINNSNVTVNGKTYNNAYLIYEHGYSYNYFLTKYQWFVPNIGLIKMNYFEGDFGNTQQYWELISYTLKTNAIIYK